MTVLGLSGNRLGERAGAAIALALLRNRPEPCRLTKLDISDNPVGGEVAISMAVALGLRWCRLRYVVITAAEVVARHAADVVFRRYRQSEEGYHSSGGVSTVGRGYHADDTLFENDSLCDHQL